MRTPARDQGINFDQAGFDAAMEEQRIARKASWKGGRRSPPSPSTSTAAAPIFEGYVQDALR
jgi:alanyl-tRNA synthetase